MGGITQQSGSALDETRQRVCIVDVVLQDRRFRRSCDQSLNWLMPTSKQPRQHDFAVLFESYTGATKVKLRPLLIQGWSGLRSEKKRQRDLSNRFSSISGVGSQSPSLNMVG